MVTEGTSALVTSFPGREGAAGARRLLDLIVRLADDGDSWRGSQGDLAARLGVQPRTVARWVAILRQRGYITTRGASGGMLEYAVLTRPRTEPTPPTPIRSGVRSGVIETIRGTIRGTSDTPDPQIQPRARAVPQSSSSGLGQSDQDPHPIRGSDQGSGGSGDGGDLSGPRELTARGEILARFHVEPIDSTVRTWAGLSERGKAIAVDKFRRFPSRKDPEHPPPALLARIVETAAQLECAGDLEALLPEIGPAEPRPAPASAARVSPPPPRRGWWRPLVVSAAIVCAAFVLTHRGGSR